MMSVTSTAVARGDLRATRRYRHLLAARLVAGVPLLGIGMMHVVSPDAPMRPLVEAAGLPLASVLAPLAVGIEIVAGVSLLLGAWARIGALLVLPTMAVAAFAHIQIDAWPNPGGEPPLALPLAVLICAAYVLWQGAGRWSLDARVAAEAAHRM